jgi:hypothetical protein
LNKLKVLIFPCGAENALEINDALKFHVNVEVWGGSSVDDHGKFVYPNYIGSIPYVQENDFVEKFNSILVDYGIEYIIPTHDTVALFLAQNRERLNAKVVCSDLETADICRNKRKTYELFKNESFCPVVYADSNSIESFPVFIKPNIGEGGKDAMIVHSRSQLESNLEKGDMLVVEYLPGDELTIDCFTNKEGVLLFVGPRTRQRIKMGISFHSESVEVTPEIDTIAKKINSQIKFRGLWFFQLKQRKNLDYKLLEVSTRCAGTMSLYRQRGINFPLLSLFDAANVFVSILDNNYPIVLDRCIKTRYKHSMDYKFVYLDLDDTLFVNGKANLDAITFVYQCLNEKKKIILITRHEKVLEETLEQFCIHTSLFMSTIKLSWNEKMDLYTQFGILKVLPGKKEDPLKW